MNGKQIAILIYNKRIKTSSLITLNKQNQLFMVINLKNFLHKASFSKERKECH